MLEYNIEISHSFFTLLAVKSTDATGRGVIPSDDNDASTTVETNNGTVEAAADEAFALSATSISCWDGLSTIDREACEQSGISTPSCEHSQICKRIDDTCGYACLDLIETPQPSDVDGQIGKFKVL